MPMERLRLLVKTQLLCGYAVYTGGAKGYFRRGIGVEHEQRFPGVHSHARQ